MYRYAVQEVVRVVDGDTVDLKLDLGFHIVMTDRFRLAGIDTPELTDPDPNVRARAQQAKEFTRQWLSANGPYQAVTIKSDHFGRWLAYLHNANDDLLNTDLLNAGLAVAFHR